MSDLQPNWDVAAAEQWFRGYAERSKATVEQLRKIGLDVYPCICDGKSCEGWAAVPRDMAATHFELCAKVRRAPVGAARPDATGVM